MRHLPSYLLAVIMLLVTISSVDAATRTATLDIKGMTCSMCPLTVRQVLLKSPGVSQAKVDFKNAAATVTFDDGATSVERLANAVTEAGFPATQRKAAP
jgi:mercuric ion binding protein